MSAETLSVAEQPQEELVLPLTVSVPEMAADMEARRRAAAFIGRVAVNEGRVDAAAEALSVKPIESLHDAIHEAARGNKEARKVVETNARTDVIERTMKSGHVIKVDLMVDEAGNIQQHGQSMESVQANSLRFAATSWQMRERVEAETTNLFRIQQCYEQGELDNYYFVVASRAADNMTNTEMDKGGFFTKTMSCALQLTTVENGRLTTETAFVSGVKKPGGPRHDQDTLRGVAAELEVNLPDETAAGTINTPFLVHKSKLKNGAIDLVRLWDENVPKDQESEEIFFGEAKPKQDYLQYLEICRQREERFEPKAQNITDRLINERRLINNRVDAVRRLHEISGEEMIDQAIGDSDIDPMVFGRVSAVKIHEARAAFAEGRYDDAIFYVGVAKANDRSGSCPGVALTDSQDKEKSVAGYESDECEFISKKCPECGKKNVKTKVTKSKITGSCGCSVNK